MKQSEFDDTWPVLQAMLQFPVADATRDAYAAALRSLPDGTFVKAVRSLVASPDWDPRTLPTLSEIREEAMSIAAGHRRGRPYIAGTDIPLEDVLDGVAVPGDHDAPVDAEAVRKMAADVLAGADATRPLVGSMGHALALRAADAEEQARAKAARKVPELTPEEWDRRRDELLRQSDELLGPGEEPEGEEPKS